MRKGIYKQAKMVGYNDQYEGESIERYCERAETTNTPIEGGAPEIFTERKDGVLPQYDIRTDRWEVAQNAMNKVAKEYQAKRAEILKKSAEGAQAETTAAS